jgi:hypothetical protein
MRSDRRREPPRSLSETSDVDDGVDVRVRSVNTEVRGTDRVTPRQCFKGLGEVNTPQPRVVFSHGIASHRIASTRRDVVTSSPRSPRTHQSPTQPHSPPSPHTPPPVLTPQPNIHNHPDTPHPVHDGSLLASTRPTHSHTLTPHHTTPHQRQRLLRAPPPWSRHDT